MMNLESVLPLTFVCHCCGRFLASCGLNFKETLPWPQRETSIYKTTATLCVCVCVYFALLSPSIQTSIDIHPVKAFLCLLCEVQTWSWWTYGWCVCLCVCAFGGDACILGVYTWGRCICRTLQPCACLSVWQRMASFEHLPRCPSRVLEPHWRGQMD